VLFRCARLSVCCEQGAYITAGSGADAVRLIHGALRRLRVQQHPAECPLMIGVQGDFERQLPAELGLMGAGPPPVSSDFSELTLAAGHERPLPGRPMTTNRVRHTA